MQTSPFQLRNSIVNYFIGKIFFQCKCMKHFSVFVCLMAHFLIRIRFSGIIADSSTHFLSFFTHASSAQLEFYEPLQNLVLLDINTKLMYR